MKMRIDLPQCNLKTCKYQVDENCVDRNRFETCEYTFAKEEIKRLEKELEDSKIDRECWTCKHEELSPLTEPCYSCDDCMNWERKQ